MDTIREILKDIKLRFRLETAIVDELEHQSNRIYSLEENRKLKDASITELRGRIQNLELLVKQMKSGNG